MSSPQTDNTSWLTTAISMVRRIIRTLGVRFPRSRSRRRSLPFGERFQPGVFVIESPQLAHSLIQQAVADGLTVTQLNGRGVTSKAAFLTAAARDLELPDSFGHNWDAFADCLGDFAISAAPGRVLILDHYNDFARAAPRDWQTALTILRRAAEERDQSTRPLYVFLQGPTDAAPGIPAITASGPGQRANSGDVASTM